MAAKNGILTFISILTSNTEFYGYTKRDEFSRSVSRAAAGTQISAVLGLLDVTFLNLTKSGFYEVTGRSPWNVQQIPDRPAKW